MLVKLSQKRAAQWLHREDGATAVEFAFLAVPFFLFVIAIIELALLMANSSILEGATNEAARLIRTGQIQQAADDPEDGFRAALCGHARILDCDRVQFNVSTIARFSEAEEGAATFDEEGNMEDREFNVGGSGDIVMIRVSYLYSLLTPVIGRFFSNYPGNRRLLMSTIIMQTEPYEFE
jgi:Flp pilus assembly protein TadG